MPRETVLPELRHDERVRCAFVEETDKITFSRKITGKVRAFSEADLRLTLDAFLRAISKAAALSEAVLEARAVRFASPAVTPAAILEALARDLGDAGFPVGFGRSWSPAPNADAAIGTGGAEGHFAELFSGHPSWVILARTSGALTRTRSGHRGDSLGVRSYADS